MNCHGTKGLEFGGNAKVDPNVVAELPKDCRVMSTETHGVSFWGNTGRINVETADGAPLSFFIKAISNDIGRNMLHGEFESMKAIYILLPNFVPKPIAWGTYQTIPDRHFFLCEYHKMMDHLPDPYIFTKHLAELHQTRKSPTGKFGFHITTYGGNLPQMIDWEDSWEVFFTKNLRLALDHERNARGPDPEFDGLIPPIFDKVIPRLLRPLESEGRSVKPCLVHGDLWYANSGIDKYTNASLVFDACCFYVHNECKIQIKESEGNAHMSVQDEFGQWRPICNRFGDEYLTAYHSYVHVSTPKEDYEGRLDLYKLRFNTHVSALFPQNPSLREQVLGDIRDSVERYG